MLGGKRSKEEKGREDRKERVSKVNIPKHEKEIQINGI